MGKSKVVVSGLGIARNDFEKLEGMLKGTHLEESLELHYLDNPNSFLLSLLKETDILLIDPLVFDKGPLDLFFSIRREFPLIQVVVVTHGNNYGVLLSALRGGIQDVIHYPWDSEEFLSVVENLLNHYFLRQKDAKLSRMLELVSLFGQGKKGNSFEGLFSEVHSFIKQQFFSSIFFIIEIGQNSQQKIFWQESKDSNENFEKENAIFYEVKDFFEGVNPRRSNFDYMEAILKREEYFLINLGEFQGENYIAIIDIRIPILRDWKLEIIGHFSRIFKGLFQRPISNQKQDELSVLVNIDDLTGLYNQRRLKSDLERLQANYQEIGEVFSILFIDLDYFKQVNDRYGHLIGSMLLTEVSKEFKKVVRESDYLYRYGGDEFIVLLPGVAGEVGKNIALRILDAITKKRFSKVFHSLIEVPFSLSVSIGVAEFPKDADTREKVLIMADEMMYQVKKKGRGAVCHAERLFSITNNEKAER